MNSIIEFADINRIDHRFKCIWIDYCILRSIRLFHLKIIDKTLSIRHLHRIEIFHSVTNQFISFLCVLANSKNSFHALHECIDIDPVYRLMHSQQVMRIIMTSLCQRFNFSPINCKYWSSVSHAFLLIINCKRKRRQTAPLLSYSPLNCFTTLLIDSLNSSSEEFSNTINSLMLSG